MKAFLAGPACPTLCPLLAFLLLSNQLVSQIIPIDPVNGVSATSEIPLPFNRLDNYLVDGSGLLDGGAHTTAVQPNMWLSRGTAFGGEDFDPSVLFDLGRTHRVTGIRVWNYNEAPPNLTTRGVNGVVVEYGLTPALGNTVDEITNFAQADGTVNYGGEFFDGFEPFEARYVRFRIQSNHGGDNAFYGLSEVQFEGVFIGAELSDQEFLTSASQGAMLGKLTTSPEDVGQSYTYELVAGEGDEDNEHFQVSGDELQVGNFDFGGASEGQEFSVRVRSTASPSGKVVETILLPTALVDRDSDGLGDTWERLWGPADLGLFSGVGEGDADQDNLSDLEEFRLRKGFPLLDPNNGDTDGDMLLDGDEVKGAGDRPSTNPTSSDSDGDGLNDGVESNSGVFVDADNTGSDPMDEDSDDDGANDFKEVSRGSDPNDPSSQPQTILAALWDFERDVDPQPDQTVFANDAAVLTGATWTDDPLRGGVMRFDGFDSYLEVPDSESLSITGDLSISAWIKVDDFGGFRGVVGKTGGDIGNQPAPYDLYLLANDGRARFFTGTGVQGEATSVTGTSTPVPGQWHHLAVTRLDDEMTIYFDGVLDGVGLALFPMADGDGTLRIGNRADFVTDFAGCLDEVAIFNGALTPEEVMKVMAGDFSRHGVGGEALRLTVQVGPSGLRFEWPTREGRLYDIVSSIDLNSTPSTWPVYQDEGLPLGDIAGTDGVVVRDGVPLIGEKRFFAVIEKSE